MPIAYPLDFRSLLAPATITFGQRTVAGFSESPFSLEQQVYPSAGAWMLDVNYPPCSGSDAEELISALVSLNGQEGTFLIGDQANKRPRGTGGSMAPVVNGNGQSGRSLVTDTWTPSRSGLLLAGDWIQLGSDADAHLHKVVSRVSSDVYGQATLEIWPALRESPTDGDAITLVNPVGTFRLAAPTFSWSIDVAKIYGVQFQAIESI